MSDLYESHKPSVVLFGAAGFVGRAIHHALSANGYPVLPITTREANLADPDATNRLREMIPDYAIWIIAASKNPDNPDPDLDIKAINIRIAENLADLAKIVPPSQLIYLSSIDVYGRSGLLLPISEHSPLQPESSYAVSKSIAEQVLTTAIMNIPLTILRLPGVYGPGDPHHGPIRSFVDAALYGNPIHIYGDGNQVRDLLYVHDVPGIVQACMTDPDSGVFNAVNGRSVSLNTLVSILAETAGTLLPIQYHSAPQVDIVFAEPALLRRYPAIHLTPIEQGLTQTFTEMKMRLNTGTG